MASASGAQTWTRFCSLNFAVYWLPKGNGEKKDISLEEKEKFMTWVQEGVKTMEIAVRLGHAPSAVRKYIAVLKALPPTTPPLPAKKGPTNSGCKKYNHCQKCIQ
jgi:hypothetical protein